MTTIKSAFGFKSTASDVIHGIDMAGRRVVVTGGAGGIGLETCRALASAGAEVVLAVRDTDKAAAAAHEIRQSSPQGVVRLEQLDLADRGSVRRFVSDWNGPLDILIANAGIMMVPDLRRTAEGWELQFATNFLGHYALAVGLRSALAAAKGARVVMVSSNGHLFSPVIYDDPNFRFVSYDPLLAYGQSKTAAILFAVEASSRWKEDGVTVNAVMPGAVASNLQQYTGGLRTPEERRKSPEQGAATAVWAATAPALSGIGGRYFEDVNEAEIVFSRNDVLSGVANYALDPSNARRLWALCERLIEGGDVEERADV